MTNMFMGWVLYVEDSLHGGDYVQEKLDYTHKVHIHV